jgi:hypothetical protein
MADSVAAVVLAAGAGRRLLPLTRLRPKPLCPVGNRTLLDRAIDGAAVAVGDLGAVAVNVHHGRGAMLAHLARRPGVHLSLEETQALGTAGAVGRLRDWLDGRAVLVCNADTWHRCDLTGFVAGWDGERTRLLTPTPLPFGPRSGVVASLLPWTVARELAAVPAGLWEACWRHELAAGRLDAVAAEGPVVDCGTPAGYLRANLASSGGRSVVGEGAEVAGRVVRSVVWPGSVVRAGECLVDAVRAEDLTVLVR